MVPLFDLVDHSDRVAAAFGNDTGLIAAVDIRAVEDQLYVALTRIDIDRAVKRTCQDVGTGFGDLRPSTSSSVTVHIVRINMADKMIANSFFI